MKQKYYFTKVLFLRILASKILENCTYIRCHVLSIGADRNFSQYTVNRGFIKIEVNKCEINRQGGFNNWMGDKKFPKKKNVLLRLGTYSHKYTKKYKKL